MCRLYILPKLSIARSTSLNMPINKSFSYELSNIDLSCLVRKTYGNTINTTEAFINTYKKGIRIQSYYIDDDTKSLRKLNEVRSREMVKKINNLIKQKEHSIRDTRNFINTFDHDSLSVGNVQLTLILFN